MAGKKAKSSYTFAVTLPDVVGVTIPQLREFLRDAIKSELNAGDPSDWTKSLDFDKIRIHLTNKEVKYGA